MSIFDGLESWVHCLWKSTHQDVFTLKINLQINLANSLPQHLSRSDSISNSEVSKNVSMFFVRGGIVPYDFQQSWEILSLTFVLGNVFVWKGTFFYLISFTNSKWSFWFFAVKSQIVLKFPFQLHFTPLLEENSFPQKIAQDMFPSYRCKINKRRGFKPCKLWTTIMWLFLHLSQFPEWIHFPWDHKEILYSLKTFAIVSRIWIGLLCEMERTPTPPSFILLKER